MRITVAATIAWVLPVSAVSQALTEADILARIAPAHPALAALLSQQVQAQSRRQLAAAPWDIDISAFFEGPSEAGSRSGASVAFSPPWDGRRRLAVAAGEAGVDAAGATVTAARMRLRAEVSAAFVDWWAAAEESQLLLAHAAELATLAERTRRRALAGEESGLAARRLAAEAARAAADAAAASARLAHARAALRPWVGELPDPAHPLPPPLPPDPGPLQDCAPPEVEVLAAALRQARHERDLAARFARFPELSVGWQRIREDGPGRWGLLAGVRWKVPLAVPARATLRAAQAALTAAEAEVQLARARAEAKLAGEREAFASLRAAAAAAARATTDAQPMVEAAVASFAAGEFSTTDLLDTLRAALDLRRRAVEAHTLALASHRTLEQVCGRELPLGGQP